MAFNGTFSKLTIAERQRLLDSGEPRNFGPGDLIIRQGTRLDGIFVIMDGEVRVEHGFRVIRKAVVNQTDGTRTVKEIPGRLSVEVTRLGRGAIFGEMSFVDDSPTSASVSAIETVKTVFINGESVRARLAADAGFAKRFYHSLASVLAKRLREANKRARGGRPNSVDAARQAAASEMGVKTSAAGGDGDGKPVLTTRPAVARTAQSSGSQR